MNTDSVAEAWEDATREDVVREVKKAHGGLLIFCIAIVFIRVASYITPIIFTICALVMTLFLNDVVKKRNRNIYRSPPLSFVGYVFLFPTLKLLMATTLICFLLSALVSWLGPEESAWFLYKASRIAETSHGPEELSFFVFVNAAILAPIYEELFFRGYLLRAYRRIGDNFAIFMSAFIFAILHGNFFQSFYTFFVGLALAVLAVRYNSILPSFLCHMLNNAVALLIRYIGEQENTWASNVMLTREIAATLPWLLWVSALLCLGAMYLFYRLFKRLRRQSESGVCFALTSREARSIFLHWPVILIFGFSACGLLFGVVFLARFFWSFL